MELNKTKWATLVIAILFAILQVLQPFIHAQLHENQSFEIDDHPFFIGTLFQPALTSTADEPNPIITAFVKKCIKHKTIIAL